MHGLPKKRTSSGQTLLVVVLVISVSLIVVMSVVARTLTDVKITGKEEESLRAFSAAEAGVEKALIAGSQSLTALDNNASFTADVLSIFQGTDQFVSPLTYLSGESATVWFVNHDASGNLVCDGTYPCYTGTGIFVCWKNAPLPAFEVSIYYTAASDPWNLTTLKIARAAYDPDSVRATSNHFTYSAPASCTITAEVFPNQRLIDFSTLGIADVDSAIPGVLKFAKIRFLYNTANPVKFGIKRQDPLLTAIFPSQGLLVSSSGTSGEANRKVNVYQAYAEAPQIWEAALFSANAIIK